MAQSHAGPIAIEIARQHPEQVSGLILFHSYARGSDHFDSPQVRAIEPLRDVDWMLYTMTSSHARSGWTRGSDALDAAALLRASLSPEMHKRLTAVYERADVSESLAEVRVPTLVLHRREFELLNASSSTYMASQIPFARFAHVKGSSNSIHIDEDDEALDEVQAFLDAIDPRSPEASSRAVRVLRNSALTDREIEVLRFVALGRHNKEIAGLMRVSIHTVERHIANAYAKIDAHSRAEAAGYAFTHGIVTGQ